MRLLIHDLKEEDFNNSLHDNVKNTVVISNDRRIHNCIGCFNCWIKTPGKCIIRDSYGNMGERLSNCSELIIISKCYYGGFSPFIKNVLDRSISYVHPNFTIRNGEMDHKKRYNNQIKLNVYFYGNDITDKEKKTAEKLIQANAINLICKSHKLTFLSDISDINTIFMEGH